MHAFEIILFFKPKILFVVINKQIQIEAIDRD